MCAYVSSSQSMEVHVCFEELFGVCLLIDRLRSLDVSSHASFSTLSLSLTIPAIAATPLALPPVAKNWKTSSSFARNVAPFWSLTLPMLLLSGQKASPSPFLKSKAQKKLPLSFVAIQKPPDLPEPAAHLPWYRKPVEPIPAAGKPNSCTHFGFVDTPLNLTECLTPSNVLPRRSTAMKGGPRPRN